MVMTGEYVEISIIKMHNSLFRKKPPYIRSVLYIYTENLLSYLGSENTQLSAREMLFDINNYLPGVRISQQIRQTCTQEGTSAVR